MKKSYYTLLFFFILSCSSSDDPINNVPDDEPAQGTNPSISSIHIESQGKFAGDDFSIIASVSDPDNDINDYEWSVSGGSFIKVTEENITWSSPEISGTYTINLTVTDAEGHSDSKSKIIDLEENSGTFQKFISATYRRLYSENDMIVIDDFIYYYSAEDTGTGTSYRLKKIGLDGNEIWTKSYAIFNTDWREISRILKTPDGNLILGIDGAIIKVDTDGNILWNYPNQNLYRFVALENGNYFFIGSMLDIEWKASFHILTPDGVLVDEGTIETNYDMALFDVVEGPSANTFFILAKVTNPDSPDNFSEVLHVDSSGNILNAYGFPFNSRTNGRLFKEADGSYSAFFSTYVDTNYRINRIHISNTGNLIINNSYIFNNYTEAFDVEQLANGGYLIAGTSGTGSNSSNSLIFRTDQSGEVVWDFKFGDNTDKLNFASSILELDNGQILVSGTTYDFNISRLKNYLYLYNEDGSL